MLSKLDFGGPFKLSSHVTLASRGWKAQTFALLTVSEKGVQLFEI